MSALAFVVDFGNSDRSPSPRILVLRRERNDHDVLASRAHPFATQ